MVEASEDLAPSTPRALRGGHGQPDEQLLEHLSHFCEVKLLLYWRRLAHSGSALSHARRRSPISVLAHSPPALLLTRRHAPRYARRSEEHTSELQSRENLVCRLLLEKRKQ